MSDITIQIVVHPRIHVGLISMHEAPPRKNGGIGFALYGPNATLSFTASSSFEIIDHRGRPLHATEISRLLDALVAAKTALALRTAFAVTITGDLATHVGMGSGTGIRLACIEALLALNEVSLPQEELVRLSERGGTSGIGIKTYFDGGLVLDLGVRNDNAGYAPSGLIRPKAPPASLPRLAVPDWEICLLLPRSIQPKSQDEEAEFFRRVLPLDSASSYFACYEALFGVYASVLEQDALTFASAIERMQDTEWKAREWQEHGSSLTSLRDKVRNLGADYVGMSSLGPMLFAGGPTAFAASISAAANTLDCDVFVTRMSNAGRAMENL